MTLLLSFSMLLACIWPIVAQYSLSSPQAPTPDIQPVNHTPQILQSTDVALMPPTQTWAESRTIKIPAPLEPVDEDALFGGTQSPPLQQNDAVVESIDSDISDIDTGLATSDSAGPLSTEVRNVLASTLHPATESSTLGTPSLREDVARLPVSPQVSQSPVHRATPASTELVITEGPIESPAEDASLPSGSGDQVISVFKETAGGPPDTVTISASVSGRLTSTSSALTKMAEAQPRPTASIILRAISTTLASTKKSLLEGDMRSTGDWAGSTTLQMTGAASTQNFKPGVDRGPRKSTPEIQSAGSTQGAAGDTSSLSSTARLQPYTSTPSTEQAESTMLSTTTTSTFTATTRHLAKESEPRGPTATKTHSIIQLTFPKETLTTGNGKQTRTGVISSSSLTPTPPLPGVREGAVPESKKNASMSMALIPPPVLLTSPSPHSPAAPCMEGGLRGCGLPKTHEVMDEVLPPNGTTLEWADLSRTLSFAWELHVFGSASLFLLLAAGGALGLVLSPATCCPLRGALLLSNGLLLLAGTLRATHFLTDPYGSRLLLPRAAVTVLVTLPLPLLLWAQAALVALVVRGAGLELELVPPALLRPPLLAVLAVLQCTLLLAADMLSPALSPAVPMVLQSLTLLAGLALCLGFLCLALPRLTRAQQQQRGKVGGRWLWRALGRVLAVCALLGALCCLLHTHTCLWLYGMLGDWRRFGWGWWLNVFWARLLELAWAFCLLLLASWLFWRPREGSETPSGPAGGTRTSVGDLSSPCQTTVMSHPHTCWAKIVQSLKGRPGRKSESAAAGGGGGAANGAGVSGGGGGSGAAASGELPNNWAGQERSGADISKSLIRNREPKDSNCSRQQQQQGSAGGGGGGSLLRLQALTRTPGRSHSSSLDRDKESAVSLFEFDLRPPSPIDLSRSIDEALHREHLLQGVSLFTPLRPPPSPSPETPSPGPWLRRNSDPHLTLTDSSGTILTESSAGLDRIVNSSVPSRQVTAPPTPTHQGPRWVTEQQVPFSLSCPVSLRPSCNSLDHLTPAGEDTRPFLTPDLDRTGSELDSSAGRRFLKVNRQDDSVSVSSDIIDL
ncbi:hypothetical protein ACEWY4_003750 [Coilia grayii]|uniref:Proline-rich transmembrane protein 3/4 domain-containing protein n=1 Tax=Coilia grayii TaxID=363190 RepID=A0ABD1KS50_9TELE